MKTERRANLGRVENQWVKHLIANGEIWDIDQLTPADKRALDRQVKIGRAFKERVPWLYSIGAIRSHWMAR